MPVIGKKKFEYSKKGKEMAKAYAKTKGMKMMTEKAKSKMMSKMMMKKGMKS
jgi:hypothetical protein